MFYYGFGVQFFGFFLVPPLCSWVLLAALGCSWSLLAAPCCSWVLLAAPGCSWLLLAAPGCAWLLLAAPGCSWLLLAALGCSWLLLAAPCCSWSFLTVRPNLSGLWVDCRWFDDLELTVTFDFGTACSHARVAGGTCYLIHLLLSESPWPPTHPPPPPGSP